MTPRVTVAVPMYNGASHIAPCIQSVLDQTYRDFELLLVDDASDDDTVAIARSFDDPRIRIVVNAERLGAAGNWNECLRLARGAYVKLLSHDDTIHPICLERQVAVLDADPELTFVTCRRDIVDGDGRSLLRDRGLNGLVGRFEADQAMRTVVRSGTNPFGEGSSVLFLRDAALDLGGFAADAAYVLDLDMWIRLALLGPAYALDETLATYRIRSGQWSMALARQQARTVRARFRRLADDPRVPVSRFDLWIGGVRASVMARMRRALYWWLAMRKR